MMLLKQFKSQRQKAEWGSSREWGGWEGWEVMFNGHRVSNWGRWENFADGWWSWLYNMNLFKTTELNP